MRLLRDCLVEAIFFFQAEDGIRDLYVTGVQTCALPIYLFRVRHGSGFSFFLKSIPTADDSFLVALQNDRSEERRVGKECRSRWLPDHEKKKGTRSLGLCYAETTILFTSTAEVGRSLSFA